MPLPDQAGRNERIFQTGTLMSAAAGAVNGDEKDLARAWAEYWRAYAADREIAFKAASAHSARVRWLKRGIVFGALAIVATLAAVSLFNPLGGLPGAFTIDRATLNGTRITMDQPRMSGFRKDGKPYTVRARTGVQDVRKPGLIELNEISARIQVEENNVVNVVAPAGLFDSGADKLKLQASGSAGFISIKSTSGFDIRMRSADMNFKTGYVQSSEPVNVRMNNGTIDADTLEVRDNGKTISFTGNVRSTFVTSNEPVQSGAQAPEDSAPPQAAPATPQEPAGETQPSD